MSALLKSRDAGYIIHDVMHPGVNGPSSPCDAQGRVTEKAGPLRRTSRNILAILAATEPLWTVGATVLVFVSYLLNMGPQWPWIGLTVLILPLPLRVLTRRPLILKPSLELPLVILMLGGLVGLVTSPDRDISLGAFQCMIAMSLLVYSWLTWGNLALLATWLIRLVPLAVLVILILTFFDLPRPDVQPNFQFGGTGTHHGLAMALVIVVSILAGIALFGRSPSWRWFAGAAAVALTAVVLVMTWESLRSLFAWVSISGRTPIWEETATLLAESPFTGLGLGCWALSYWGTAASIPEPTHAHNAYLELYANTGILGIVALVVALAVGAKLAWAIIKSPRSHPWYGFGIGVVIACGITLLLGVVESAPVGVPLVAEDTYYYLISPVPWILAGLLVAARDLLKTEARE